MAKELVYRVRIDYDTSEAAKGAQNIDRSQEQAEQSVDKTTAAIRRQQQAQEQTTKSTRNYSKVQSNANQTLFSFGDLLNDSQQFQFGFASGTRAIGNNIGFAAEQFSQISSRAGGFRNALSALGSSLLGPGGAILAINAVVTAVTVFGDKLFDSEKSVKRYQDALDELSSSFEKTIELQEQFGAFEDDEFGIAKIQAQIQEVTEAIGFQRDELEEVNRLEQERSDIVQQAARGEQIDQERLNTIDTILDRKQSESEIESRINELQNRRVELSAELVTIGDALADSDVQQARAQSEQRKELERMQEIEESRLQAAKDREQAFDRPEDQLLQPDIDSNLEQIDNLMKARRERLSQLYDLELNRFLQFEQSKTQIQKAASAQRSQIFTNALSATADLIGQAFNQSKEMAIAQTLISTYASAQKAYESQLAIPTPDAPARAAAAAAVAIAQGLARLASIRSTNMGSGGSGGGSSSSGGSSIQTGVTESDIPGADRSTVTSAAQSRSKEPNLIVEANNVLPDTEFSVRSERGGKRRRQNVVSQGG